MKAATHVRLNTVRKTFGLDKIRAYIACGDGSTYVVERPADEPATRWEPVERIEPDGQRVRDPRTVPTCVERQIARIIRA